MALALLALLALSDRLLQQAAPQDLQLLLGGRAPAARRALHPRRPTVREQGLLAVRRLLKGSSLLPALLPAGWRAVAAMWPILRLQALARLPVQRQAGFLPQALPVLQLLRAHALELGRVEDLLRRLQLRVQLARARVLHPLLLPEKVRAVVLQAVQLDLLLLQEQGLEYQVMPPRWLWAVRAHCPLQLQLQPSTPPLPQRRRRQRHLEAAPFQAKLQLLQLPPVAAQAPPDLPQAQLQARLPVQLPIPRHPDRSIATVFLCMTPIAMARMSRQCYGLEQHRQGVLAAGNPTAVLLGAAPSLVKRGRLALERRRKHPPAPLAQARLPKSPCRS